MKKPITQRDVNLIFRHVPARTLRQWALDGFYEWVTEEENGRGIHREYSYLNLLQIALTEELAKANYPSRAIHTIMYGFSLDYHRDEQKALGEFDNYLVVTWPRDEGPMQARPAPRETLKEYLGSGAWRKVMVIDLSAIREKVDRLIKTNLE